MSENEVSVAKARKPTQKRGWAFAMCLAIVKPPLVAFTKHRWVDAHKLPAEGGCVLAGNHVSHLDPFTFAHFVYDNGRLPRFLAKAEVFDVPVGGKLLARAGQIPVYRMTTNAPQAFRAAVEAVGNGESVVVYPEGTITREPNLWPMVGKTGAARIALAAGVPVIPIAQWGAQDILAPYAKRPDLFPRKTITMKVGDPVDLDDLRSLPQTTAILREATNRIMAAITALLEDLRDDHAPDVLFDPKAQGVRQIGNPNQILDKPSKKRVGRKK